MLPGAYYTAGTRDRFEQVAAILSEAQLTRDQVATAVAWLDRAARDSESETDAVLSALSKVAGLDALSELVPNGHHERHGFVGLLLALLDAGVSSSPDRGGSQNAPRAYGSRGEPTHAEHAPVEEALDPSPVMIDPLPAKVEQSTS